MKVEDLSEALAPRQSFDSFGQLFEKRIAAQNKTPRGGNIRHERQLASQSEPADVVGGLDFDEYGRTHTSVDDDVDFLKGPGPVS